MLFANSVETLGSDLIREADQRRPQAPMDIRDLTIDEAADENIGGIAHRARHAKDCSPLRVSPPTSQDQLPNNRLSKRGNGALAALKDNTLLLDESDRLIG